MNIATKGHSLRHSLIHHHHCFSYNKWYPNGRYFSSTTTALGDSLLQPSSSVVTTTAVRKQPLIYPNKTCVHHGTIRFNSSVGDDKGNHDLFLKQMMDLKQEQEEIFGVPNDDDNDSTIILQNNDTNKNDDLIQLAQKAQALQLQQQQQQSTESDEDWEARSEEREAVYDFSQQEKDAWSNNNNNTVGGEKKLSSSLMESIHKARQAQMIYEDEQKKLTNQKRQNWIQDTVTKYNMSNPQPQQQNNDDSNNHTLFTHLNKSGQTVSMVDVGAKVVTRRIARARSIVVFPPEVMEAFQFLTPSNDDENKKTEIIGPKGPIFATAKIAGIMGAK